MRRSGRWRSMMFLVLFGLAIGGGEAEGRVYMTQKQALATAFPSPQEVRRETLYLTAEQAKRVSVEAGVPMKRNIVPYYIGLLDGRPTGYAYFDTHLVRTLPETIMVHLAADARIVSIDILSFDEPEDYLPGGRWLRQFNGRRLNDELSLKRGIRGLTGATLSSRAITQAARRVLTLHRLFVAGAPKESPAVEGKSGS